MSITTRFKFAADQKVKNNVYGHMVEPVLKDIKAAADNLPIDNPFMARHFDLASEIQGLGFIMAIAHIREMANFAVDFAKGPL